MFTKLLDFDRIVFYWVNDGLHHRLLDLFMPWVTRLGSWELVLAAGLFFLFSKKREKRNTGLLLLAGLCAVYALVFVLKTGIARPRPFEVLGGARCLIREEGFSFPSGHAAKAFMLAVFLAVYFKKNRYVFYVLAFGVGLSRVYLGVHFPSDVAAGALVGIAVGYAAIRLRILCHPSSFANMN